MPLAPGDRLARHEILGLLGAGGMGDVYRALDATLEREVAIKVLPDALAQHPERLARFAREARLLASISHPNIAVVHGLELWQDRYYLEMELVRGETLAARLARGPLPLDDALQLFKQIAEALEAAHAQGIVHRDLKPANIMVTPQGVVKILDFGLAKIVAGDDSAPVRATLGSDPTIAGVVMGTPSYMSPEHARGDPVDRRTDIWAFGCLFYEALTGAQAFPGRTVSDIIAAVLRTEPDWTRLSAAASPRVERLIRRCLQKNPHQRLHDIADARIEIDEALSDSLSRRVIPEAVPRAPRSRRIVVLAGAAGAALALSLAAGAWLASRSPASPPAPVARVMIELAPGHALETGRFSSLALSPDGRQLVYAASTNGSTQLFLRRIDEAHARVIPGTEGGQTPVFSSDGQWLAYYADGAIRKQALAGGVPLTIAAVPPVWSIAWRGTDVIYATTLAGAGLWRVSSDGGESDPLTTPGQGETLHGYPQILPGGTQVVFSVLRENGWRPAVLSLANRQWHLLGDGRVLGEGATYLPSGHLVYVRSGGLMATRFDPRRVELAEEPPTPLPERLDTAPFGGVQFAVAADAGTLVYAPAKIGVADRALLRIERDGRAAPLIDHRLGFQDPAFSPDGRRVAVTIASSEGSDIWIIELDRGTRTRLTTDNASAFPVWAPDGSRVAFQSVSPGPWNLYWRDVDGGSEPRALLSGPAQSAAEWPDAAADVLPGTLPTLSGANPQFPVSWGGQPSSVAFHERKANGERDIWVVTPGSPPAPFLLTPFDERTPRFSPDGAWLAYVSDESGRDEVYVQPYPGPGRKFLVSTDGGTDPVWSRNGQEIFYRRGDDLMAVAVQRATEFSAGQPRRLFHLRFDRHEHGPGYDVSPDGQRFVATRYEDPPTAGSLHLVINWAHDVASRATGASAR